MDSVKHGTHFNNAKLNDNKIKKIKKLHLEGVSNKEIAKIFNISQPNVSLIINHKRWRHIK
jgi:transposase